MISCDVLNHKTSTAISKDDLDGHRYSDRFPIQDRLGLEYSMSTFPDR